MIFAVDRWIMKMLKNFLGIGKGAKSGKRTRSLLASCDSCLVTRWSLWHRNVKEIDTWIYFCIRFKLSKLPDMGSPSSRIAHSR